MKFIKIPNQTYEMQDAPVTQSEWTKVMGSNPSYFKGANNPVELVSYNDAQDFIKKLNDNPKNKYVYRLPSEEEWEYCAKSCDNQRIKDIAWCYENSDKETHAVKKKKPNKLGLYDMLGNVWEWTQSLYNKDSFYRVIRGGSWFNDARGLRSAYRINFGPANRDTIVGFRLVRTLRSSILPTYSKDTRAERALNIAKEALKKIEEILGETL
jgi:formylglycine-generating enzyme required for sulfatase activity